MAGPIIRRRSAEDREKYVNEKAPALAQRLNITEEEARRLLGTGSLGVAPDLEPDPEQSGEPSVRFVHEIEDDETWVFYVEFEGSEPVEVGRAAYDGQGSSGMDAIRETLRRAAEAVGAGWVER